MNANQGDKDRESHFVRIEEQKTKIGKKQENQRPFRCKNTQVSCNEDNQFTGYANFKRFYILR